MSLMYMPLPPEWLERLKLGPRVGRELIIDKTQATGHPYGETIRKALDAGVSGVFCLNDSPCAAIVLPPQGYTQNWLQELYIDLWNQGELDFLLLLHPDRVDIHTLDTNPRALGASAAPLSSTILDVLRHTEEIESIITGLESGRLLEKKKVGLNAEARVDVSLIRDLEGARQRILTAEGFEKPSLAPKERIAQVHDVLLQSMFLLYLEDRGIIEAGYIHQHGNLQAGKLHELLGKHPSEFPGLLERLDHDLNGGLFKANPLWVKHAHILAEFLHGMWNFNNGQGRLLRLYRFEHIPVELLSEVYDRFLGSEGAKKEQGAYYTPRRLAAIVVEQSWETIRGQLDTGRIPRILDPSCGSGIFPALLFQRIADYLQSPSWLQLKQIAEHLYGIDINPTAIRISAFSLYLALLHRADPKELRELMRKGKVLPELLGKTLTQGDFFDLSAETHYDCIIGNPPWGTSKQKEDLKGKTWMRAAKCPEPDRGERSWPFIWKSLKHLPLDGTLALLLPSTGFFLNDVKKSLTALLDVARLKKLIDLSDLRFCLFAGADFPACILLATRVEKNEPQKFEYLCPKADLNATRGDRIILASNDYHLAQAYTFAADSVSTTQRLMWCGPIERRLLSYLDTLPTLRDFPLLSSKEARQKSFDGQRPEWGIGMGFQSYQGKGERYFLPELMHLPHLKRTKDLTPLVQCNNSSWKPYGTQEVARQKFAEGFIAPHIVVRASIDSDCRTLASYAEHSFSFNNSFIGITVPDSDIGRQTGKFLTAFLNSAFVAWYLGTGGLAVNRPRFSHYALWSIPFPLPEDLPDPKKAETIRAAVVAIMNGLMRQAHDIRKASLQSTDFFPPQKDIRKLDDLIFSYLGIRSKEIVTIRENLDLVRKASQPARRGQIPALWGSSEQVHWDSYCQALSTALSIYMEDNDQAYAEAIGFSQDVVVVKVIYQQKNEDTSHTIEQRSRATGLADLPHDLLAGLERPLGGNIYLQRCATVFTTECILLVKPRQRRFWLTSAAQSDADYILNNLIQAAASATGSA